MDITINQIKTLYNSERLIKEMRKKLGDIDERQTFMLDELIDEMPINDVHLLMSLQTQNETSTELNFIVEKYFLNIVKKVTYLLTRKSAMALRTFEDYTNGTATNEDVKQAVIAAWEETKNNNHQLCLNKKIINDQYAKSAQSEACQAVFSLARIFVSLIGVQNFDKLGEKMGYTLDTNQVLQQAFANIGESCSQALAFDAVAKIGVETMYMRTLNFENSKQIINAKSVCKQLRKAKNGEIWLDQTLQ